MGKINKILLTIFIVFSLVVIFELIYYSYYLNKKTRSFSTITPTQNISNSETTVEDPPILVKNPVDIANSSINLDTLGRWLTILRWYKKGILTSSQLVNKYQGKIIKIDKNGGRFLGGESDFNGKKYNKSMVLEGSNNDTNWFFITQDKGIFERNKSTGEDKAISFDQLQLNDQIEIEQAVDLTSEFAENIINYKIVKVN